MHPAAPAPTPHGGGYHHTTGQNEFVHDAELVSTSSHEFFAEILPDLLEIFLVVSIFALLTWVWTSIWSFLLRRCFVPENIVRLTAALWGLLICGIGVFAAFRAVGVDFGQILLSAGLVSIAVTAGGGEMFANFWAGLSLQTHGLYANHQRVRLSKTYDNLTGSIVSMSWLHVVIKPDAPASPGNGFVPDHVLVPNKAFTNEEVGVEWRDARTPAYEGPPSRHQPRFMATPTPLENRERGEEKRHSDAPTTGRFVANPPPPQTDSKTRLLLMAKQALDQQRRFLPPHADVERGPSGWTFDSPGT